MTHPYSILADNLRQVSGQVLAITENSKDDDEFQEAAEIADILTGIAHRLEARARYHSAGNVLLFQLHRSNQRKCEEVGNGQD